MNLLYDPQNANYRALSSAFWDKYSKEDTSWRDQPLWRYFVDKLQLHPGPFIPLDDQVDAFETHHHDFWIRHGHSPKYDETWDGDAKKWFVGEDKNSA